MYASHTRFVITWAGAVWTRPIVSGRHTSPSSSVGAVHFVSRCEIHAPSDGICAIRNSRATLDVVFDPEAVPADYATRGGGLLGLRPSAFLFASDDLRALPDCLPVQETRYGELRVPVSILYGKDDRILDWRAHGQALADKVPGATLQLIEGGHMLPITNPDATAAFIDAAAAQATLSASAVVNAARS